MAVKLAVIGGGSLFVPSVVNGVGRALRQARVSYEVELALYDVQPEKAERMRAYAEVVSSAWGVPVRAVAPRTRPQALEGADVVLVSVWLAQEHARLDRLVDGLGFTLPEEGPAVAGWALALAPWNLELAAEMRRQCPQGLFVTLSNPTDVLAGIVGEGGGIRAAGLCVEVDGLRGALSYHLRVPSDRIGLVHAGVNHDGWGLEFTVDGRDGYALLRSRRREIEGSPDLHPGSRGIWPILDLTGHLRSSAYHNWPLGVERPRADSVRWSRWRGKRERYERAVADSLRTGQPISDPPSGHPELSRLNYPHTGVAIGKLLESIATCAPSTVPFQVPNQGAISNFPDDAVVEVPVQVAGDRLDPQFVGELPEWLGGYTRLLALMIFDFLTRQ